LWYGAPSADAVGWAVPQAVNVVSLGPAARARAIAERYRRDWAALGRAERDLPMIGITRHVVVAATDAAAKDIAQRAYPRWQAGMEYIWLRSGADFALKEIYPAEFDALEAIGHGIAGSPSTVRRYLEALQREAGVNYVLCQMMFGDMALTDAAASVSLFGRDVLPAFR